MRFRKRPRPVRARPFIRLHFHPMRIRNPFKLLVFCGFFLFILSFPFIYIFEQKVEETLVKMARSEVKQIAQGAMNNGVKKMKEDIGEKMNEAMVVDKDEEGIVRSLQVDQYLQSQIYESITEGVREELRKASMKDMGIPIGSITDSAFLVDKGPEIPFQFWPKGSSHVNMAAYYEPVGINMVAVRIEVKVRADLEILFPSHENSNLSIEFDYPIAQHVIAGEVPDNYYNYQNEGEEKGTGERAPIPIVPVP
ncbi:sporulation protein YunB [Mechercharimyces sp. CAU 1602]|uniref:sporulation protein YunB n=1 Tax=Mechercharimyces sp. CAU 1602 TaxID=2973933 RepID=UPI002163CABB|nr:sporulation protein YunB [Mechercharimyces sp. CAU 1602]MCS1352639.1 sporulation protein YunB [Mechercharimyces sp. CAU 1602]